MPYVLSPSTINLMTDCKKCFWLQFRKNIKRPEGIFPSLPSGMDRILKEHFDSYIDKEELPPEFKKHKIEARLFSDRKLLDRWRNYKQGIAWADENGNILRGAVDNILVNGKKLIVLDYKTRGYEVKSDTHEHYRNQLDFYNFMLRKNGYETEDYSYLIFYHPDKVLDNVFLFHTHLVKVDVNAENAGKIFSDAIKLLGESMPPPSDGCAYCKYRDTKINNSLLDY